MASRRVPRTFRATNVPCSTSKSSLEAAVCTLCDPTEKDSIKIRTTIAPSCTDAKRSQTAIITFDPSTPQKLAQASKVYIIVDGADVEIDSDFFGLTQLYPPRGKKVSADIVAVTGLNGHAFGSWSGGPSKKMWLRDFLCEDDVLKTCRTMIFGYNSKLRDAADHSMFEYVRSFLGELSKARSSEEERRRPIIFIGHSFGGNIITHSLPYAKTYESDAKICSIVKATYGMHFFGVPHNGIALDDVVDMVKDGSKPERVELVNEIINTAKSLTFPKENFKNMATNLKIVSFYETNMTKKVIKGESGYGRDGDHIMVVKRESAVLGLPSSIETAIPVDENHSSMVKFPTRTNKTYEHVRSFLQDWVKAAEKVVSERFEEDKSPLVQFLKNLHTAIEPSYLSSQALRIAAYSGLHHDILQLLIAGADPNFYEGLARRYMLKATQAKHCTFPTDISFESGETALSTACKKGHKEIAQILLRNGANPNLAMTDGTTPLHLTARRGHGEIVYTILQYRANPDLCMTDGTAPLHIAAKEGHMAIVRQLLEHHANPNATDMWGTTPLHEAVRNMNHGHLITSELLARGADPNSSLNHSKNTPLHLAANAGHAKTVELLLEGGANPERANVGGRRALHEATEWGRYGVVERLLVKGADIHAQDRFGSTALHEAARKGHGFLIPLLMKKGANANARLHRGRGKTPLELAREKGHSGAVEALESYLQEQPSKQPTMTLETA